MILSAWESRRWQSRSRLSLLIEMRLRCCQSVARHRNWLSNCMGSIKLVIVGSDDNIAIG